MACAPPLAQRLNNCDLHPVSIEKTMSLTLIDIDRLAHLARLGLQPAERTRLCTQLNDFFGIVEKMRAVDTSGIVPLAHPVDVMQEVALRLRDDIASEPNQRAANQRSAPAVDAGLFLVPKVIE
jgi:aspartyl-tRNA(Asn)/glutamyl-tRNA(Gln) amidotransferase subunit C